jgi:peptide/nickel transport system substrate-binding protein
MPRVWLNCLAEMWGQIGIALEPQAVDPDALTAQCCPAFDFDIMIWGWAQTLTQAPCSTCTPPTPFRTVRAKQAIRTLSMTICTTSSRSTLDFEARKDIVWEMQRIVHEDVVYIIPFYDSSVQAFRTDRFTGWITDQAKVEFSDVTSLTQIEPVK